MLTGNVVIDGILIIGAVATALGATYRWFVAPLAGVASTIKDAVDAIPDHETMIKSNAALLTRNADRLDQIDGRLDIGADNFAAINKAVTAMSGRLGQPSNGESLCELVERHSKEDQANFAAIGMWTANFKDFDPLELPYSGTGGH